MTRWIAAVIVASGCAAAPAVQTDWLSKCTLKAETACTTYGASIAGAPESLAGQLALGLADKAIELPPEEAVDYWYRLEELLEAGSQTDEVVNRRAALSFASLAALDRDELAALDLESVDEAKIDAARDIQHRLLRRAEFGIRWGSAAVQATAARALADGYYSQARVMGAIAIPAELTPVARVEFEKKRDALAGELSDEAERLRSGLAQHCRRHKLQGDDCDLAPRPAP